MKLRLKLILISAILCSLAIAACCGMLVVSSNKSNVSQTVENAVAEQHMLVNSLKNAISGTYQPNFSYTTQNSLAKYLFRRFSSNTFTSSQYALKMDGEYISNMSGIDIEILLDTHESIFVPEDNFSTRYCVLSLYGRRHIAIGSAFIRSGRDYNVFLLRDIEQIYRDNSLLAARVSAIGATFILLTAAALSFAVYRTLRPLKHLEAGALAVANGDYASRLVIEGNDEITTLSQSFNTMAEAVESHIEQLRHLAESRRLLLGALTHELKTPMTSIIGYSEALMRTKLTQVQQNEAVSYINAECTRLERLSQKLMKLISLEGEEKPQLVPMNVSELFASVERTIRPIGEDAGIDVTISCDGTSFPMDGDLMESLIINLFDNARKSGAKHIRLTCQSGVISLEDDGCGIPEGALKRITEPFYMADKSRSRKAGGAGLGLALVERIAALHGGELIIRSKVGTGTCVEITF